MELQKFNPVLRSYNLDEESIRKLEKLKKKYNKTGSQLLREIIMKTK